MTGGGRQQGVNMRVSQVVYLGRKCAKHEKKKTPVSNFQASKRPFITSLSAEEVSRRGGGRGGGGGGGSVSLGGHSQAGHGIGRELAVA